MTALINLVVMFNGQFETRQRTVPAATLEVCSASAVGEGLAILRKFNRAYVAGAHVVERYKSAGAFTTRLEAHAGGSVLVTATIVKTEEDDLLLPLPSPEAEGLARLRGQADAGYPARYTQVTPDPAAAAAVAAIFGPMRRRAEDWENGPVRLVSGEEVARKGFGLLEPDDNDGVAWSAGDILDREG